MTGLDLPVGQPVEIESVTPGKPVQQAIVEGPLPGAEGAGQGIWVAVIAVPESLGFGEPFRVEVVRKWLNLATIAELRLLPEGALEATLEQRRQLHEAVRERLG